MKAAVVVTAATITPDDGPAAKRKTSWVSPTGVAHDPAPAATAHHIALRPPVQEETSVLDVDETAELTPEERLAEVAAILARGYLRLQRNRPDVAQPPEAGGTLLSAASERESRRRSRG